MAVGVICEFNPFHNGHKYLLQTIKNRFNEPTVAVMSGAFTQRGEAAICDKFTRARTALENGADLVLELPAAFVLSGTRAFSRAGVKILSSFAGADKLVFGSECGDIDVLCTAARATKDERVQAILRERMQSGGYYPRELELAVKEIYGGKISAVLSQPNNILALEYIKAIEDLGLGGKITPLTVRRIGAEHDGSGAIDGIASASYIRELLRCGRSDEAERLMPCKIGEFTRPELLDRVLLYKIRSVSAQRLSDLPEVSEGLENRILTAAKTAQSASELADIIKTKRYTHARIRRSLACALFDIDKAAAKTPIEYVRVLGFTQNGEIPLGNCSLNVVTSAAKGLKIGGNTEKLLKIDIAASDVQALAYSVVHKSGADFTAPVIKVN